MMNRWHVAKKTQMDGDWRLEGKECSVFKLKLYASKLLIIPFVFTFKKLLF